MSNTTNQTTHYESLSHETITQLRSIIAEKMNMVEDTIEDRLFYAKDLQMLETTTTMTKSFDSSPLNKYLESKKVAERTKDDALGTTGSIANIGQYEIKDNRVIDVDCMNYVYLVAPQQINSFGLVIEETYEGRCDKLFDGLAKDDALGVYELHRATYALSEKVGTKVVTLNYNLWLAQLPDIENYNLIGKDNLKQNITLPGKNQDSNITLRCLTTNVAQRLEESMLLLCDVRALARSPAVREARDKIIGHTAKDVDQALVHIANVMATLFDKLSREIMTIVMTQMDTGKWRMHIEPAVTVLKEYFTSPIPPTATYNLVLQLVVEIMDELISRYSNQSINEYDVATLTRRFQLLRDEADLCKEITQKFGYGFTFIDTKVKDVMSHVVSKIGVNFTLDRATGNVENVLRFISRTLTNTLRANSTVRVPSGNSLENKATLSRMLRRLLTSANQSVENVKTMVDTKLSTQVGEESVTSIIMPSSPYALLVAASKHTLLAPALSYSSALKAIAETQCTATKSAAFREIATSKRHAVSLCGQTKASFTAFLLQHVLGYPCIDNHSFVYFEIDDIVDKGQSRRNKAIIKTLDMLGNMTKQTANILLAAFKSPKLAFPSLKEDGQMIFSKVGHDIDDEVLKYLANEGMIPTHIANISGLIELVTTDQLNTMYTVMGELVDIKLEECTQYRRVVIVSDLTQEVLDAIKETIVKNQAKNDSQWRKDFVEFLNRKAPEYLLVTQDHQKDDDIKGVAVKVPRMTLPQKTITLKDISDIKPNHALAFVARLYNMRAALRYANAESFLCLKATLLNVAAYRKQPNLEQTWVGQMMTTVRLINVQLISKIAILNRYSFGGKNQNKDAVVPTSRPALTQE